MRKTLACFVICFFLVLLQNLLLVQNAGAGVFFSYLFYKPHK